MTDERAGRLYVGLDDTDNLDSRGTGHQARNLAEALKGDGLGIPIGVTRHQLLVHPDIPYTSHNSSACIEIMSDRDPEEVAIAAAAFLTANAAPGSDPGLCVARAGAVAQDVQAFGRRAKTAVLRMDEAVRVAQEAGLHLSAHGGTGQGIIGALAAVGLREKGSDGRFLWLKGIREMTGIFTVSEILSQSGVRCLMVLADGGEPSTGGAAPSPNDAVDVGEWFRPVLLGGVPTLLITADKPPAEAGGAAGAAGGAPDAAAGAPGRARWRIVDKEIVKRY